MVLISHIGKGIEMKKETIKKAVSILFALYIPVLFFILFLYRIRTGEQFELEVFSEEHFNMVNYIPFATIISFFERAEEGAINRDIVVRNMAANLLMFVPMGMALPVLFEKKFNKLWKMILFMLVLVSIIEVTQFLTFYGSADVDDLILNVVSAVIGYSIIQIRFVRRILKLS